MKDEIADLIEKIEKLPTLEERVVARDAALDELLDHRWDFRDPTDFPVTYECGNCDRTFLEDWEPKAGYMQPPGMPSGWLCEPCWNDLAEQRWAQEQADRAAAGL